MTDSPSGSYSTEEGQQRERYTARQPILSVHEKVIGYELLFRSGLENHFKCSDPNDATRSVIDVSSLQGLDILCDQLMAFINCTRDVLLNGDVSILPPGRAVVEILETVTPDTEVRQACVRLRGAGYKIALDDFGIDDPRAALADLADFIKVDLVQTPLKDAAGIVKKYGGGACAMLAEKVETREAFIAAREAGFRFFQGYFFRKPELMHIQGVVSSNVTSLRLLHEVSKPELNLETFEEAIKTHPTLTVRLLRYLNSAAFTFSSRIRSLKHALTILGGDELRRWCRLALMLEMTQNKPSELLLSTLVRARFSELLGAKVEHGASDLFLLGLLSLMDSILGIPLELVMEALPLGPDIRSALLKERGTLAPIYKLVLAVEAGSWQETSSLCEQLHLSERFVAESHWKAMGWARDVVTATGSA
jgi:c-di-GMP-related signal transduction protein